ncbi:MAG: hypothetical protein NWE95_08430 [Candidatus Bathyarchaeota archaeon]|nr:hypothetical protein [Candidatus Bathyarchaeota archaeon]
MFIPMLSMLSASTQLPDTNSTSQSGLPIATVVTSVAKKSAGPESQFQVGIAYAYVGPPPSDKISYYDPKHNVTMIHASKYPSAVYLNFTRAPSIQIKSCDAVIEVYGIQVATDTGITEYHAWSAGINYTSFTLDQQMTLVQYSNEIIDKNRYRSSGGTFSYNWTDNDCRLSKKIGSVGIYTGYRPNKYIDTSLLSAGAPNSISVTIYRLGYLTMSNGSITVYKESITDKPLAEAQLNKYEDGFIYNKILPAEQLAEVDLFHPIR